MRFIEKMFSLPGRRGQSFSAFQKLDQKLKCPHRSFASIHVAGTNGKGSVCYKIAKFLQSQGFRVGLYSSPHITSFTERIVINQVPISEKCAEELLESIFSHVEEKLSFFALMTMLAFLYFQKTRVDYAVIEVGMGGRCDPTNVITPLLSIITTIGWDHQEILGDTLEKIAREKGGIQKKGVPLIVGPQAAPFFPRAFSAKKGPFSFYDQENEEIAKLSLRHLGFFPKEIKEKPPCRFEEVGGAILDAAHNELGWQRLKSALLLFFPQEIFHFILGFSKGKKVKSCIEMFESLGKISCMVDFHKRAKTKKELEEELGPIECIQSIEEGMKQKKGKVVITGSFFLMQEARLFFAQSK